MSTYATQILDKLQLNETFPKFATSNIFDISNNQLYSWHLYSRTWKTLYFWQFKKFGFEFRNLTNKVAIFQNPVHENSSQQVYLTLNWVIFSIEWKTSASKMSWLKMTRVSLICDKEESSLVLFSELVAFGGWPSFDMLSIRCWR